MLGSHPVGVRYEKGSVMTSAKNASIATVQVGDRSYPHRSIPSCKVCRSGDLRRVIEMQTVEGRTWHSIVEGLPKNCGLTARNVRDHFANGHIPLRDEAVQQVATEHSRKRGE